MGCHSIIGVSMSKLHTSELNAEFLSYIVRRLVCFKRCNLTWYPWAICRQARFSYNLISQAASLAFSQTDSRQLAWKTMLMKNSQEEQPKHVHILYNVLTVTFGIGGAEVWVSTVCTANSCVDRLSTETLLHGWCVVTPIYCFSRMPQVRTQ